MIFYTLRDYDAGKIIAEVKRRENGTFCSTILYVKHSKYRSGIELPDQCCFEAKKVSLEKLLDELAITYTIDSSTSPEIHN